MDSIRILVIGEAPAGLRSASIDSLPNLAEYNAVVLAPAAISNLGSGAAISKSMQELVAWTEAGHLLIMFNVVETDIKLRWSYGGTTHVYTPFATAPFREVEFQKKSGDLIEYCGPESLAKKLAWMAPLFGYKALLKSPTLLPLFKVSRGSHGEDQIVGGLRNLGKGTVIFVPHFTGPAPEKAAMYRALADVPALLVAPPDSPDWLGTFQTTKEIGAHKNIAKANSEVAYLMTQISKGEAEIEQEASLKRLFAATGDEFANAVEMALREIDMHVVKGPRGRADLLAMSGSRLAAIEAKGLENFAKEADFRETQQWVSEVLVTLTKTPEEVKADSHLSAYRGKLDDLEKASGSKIDGSECKGIMVVGTHRKTPLGQRPESYPDSLSSVIGRSEVCALTGLQLFQLVMRARASTNAKSDIRELLFATNGVLKVPDDWTSVLTKIEE